MSQLEIRGIIAAIDFSDWTRPVLQMAAELAAKYEAPLTAMYAELFVMTAAEQGGGDMSDLDREGHERRLCEWVGTEFTERCQVRPVVRAGDPAKQTLQMAGDAGADLVVIGAQHRPFLGAAILGTTSVRVMRHATCPVLTLPMSVDRDGSSE